MATAGGKVGVQAAASDTEEERLRYALETVVEGYWDWNLVTNECWYSPLWTRSLGYSEQDPGGSIDFWKSIVHPEDWPRVMETLQAHFDGRTAVYECQNRLRARSGEYRLRLDRGKVVARDPSGRPLRMIGTDTDFGPRQRAEEALARSEALFRTLFEQAAVGMAQVAVDGRLLRVNQKLCDILGYPRDELLGSALTELAHAEDRAQELADMRALLAGAVTTYSAETRRIRKDRSLVWVHLTASPVYAARSEPEHLVCLVEDISARKGTEAALRRSEETLRVAQELAGMGSWELELSTGSSRWSAEMFPLFERDPELGAPAFDEFLTLLHPDDLPAMLALHERVLRRPGAQRGQFRIRCATGTIKHFAATAARLPRSSAQDGDRIAGVVLDVTEFKRVEEDRKLMEERLRQSHKMEAVGRLAGGIAHDFNNLLTVIIASSETALGRGPANAAVLRELEAIRDAGQRAAALTKQLLAFGRKQMLEPRVLDLNSVLASLEPMLRRIIGEDVLLSVALDPCIDRVQVDPSQLEQVILNLAVNARDAMPEGGRLDIATGNREYHEPAIAPGAELKRGRYVVLSIADTGRGMSREIAARIFEPFFTTKEPGLGTGLGLATSYGIVRQSGGHIAVHSEPGSGTRFEVYLPAVAAIRHAADPSGPPPSRGERGVEVILLVEDEAMVRTLVRTMLEDHGYTVLEASTPSAALAMARAHRGAIHLLLTDVVMPELGGRRLAEALRNERADIAVLYMSGYTDDAVLRHGVVEEVEAFLQKPFSVVELLQKVRDVLDARTQGARQV